MLILGIDASAVSASAALWDGEKIVSQCCVNNRLTHSQTLLPLIWQVLENGEVSLEQLDLLAVSSGPGSFTGLRIGLATVKGLCCGSGVPCLGVSTLEALAYNLEGFSGTACSVMDARIGQVYQAAFSLSPGQGDQPAQISRLSEDRAVSLQQLAEELENCKKNIYLVGDGANLCYNTFGKNIPHVFLAPPQLRWQQGASVARLAGKLWKQGTKPLSPGQLFPSYLRLSQAERERRAREAKTETPNTDGVK